MTIDRIETSTHRWGLPALAVMVAALASGCAGESGDAAAADGDAGSDGAARTERVINVEARTVEARPFVETIRITGEVEAAQDVIVSAEESGPVVERFVEKGSTVRAGDPLVRIDASVLRSQVAEARAQARLAEETWERRKKLFEEDRALSELQYLEAKYRAEEARARLETLEARLAKTTIRAPITGIFEDRYVEVGSMVSPGTRVARILDVRTVKVAGGIPERYAGDVAPGTPAEVTFPALRDATYRGEISFVGAAVDDQSRTFPIEVEVPNPEGTMKPRMVADVELVRKRWEDAVVVPQEALVRVSDGFAAFVVAGDEGAPVARARLVEPGPRQGNEVLIRSGLRPGDRLIVVGQQRISGGDRVRIVNDAPGESG